MSLPYDRSKIPVAKELRKTLPGRNSICGTISFGPFVPAFSGRRPFPGLSQISTAQRLVWLWNWTEASMRRRKEWPAMRNGRRCWGDLG